MTTELIIAVAAVVVGIVLLILFFKNAYVKTPPSTALIISGISKNPRVLIGTGGWKIPFFERIDRVYLGQMSVDIKTSVPVPTKDFINVNVDAVAKIRVKPDSESVRLAAKNFLNMTQHDIQESLQDSLEGNMREIIGTLELKPLNNDRDSFSDQIASKAGADMDKLGIEILSCNIQNVTDTQGLITDLGADNTWKIKKEAAITKAQSEKEIKVAEAQATKEANDARVISETAIAERNNELAIKQAELKQVSDTKKADADAAYAIQQQDRQLLINERTVEAEIAKTKKEQELTEERIKIRENELQAEVNKQADAEKYQTQINAEAAKVKTELDAAAELERRKKEAEAKRYEAEQEAAAIKAKAEADLFAKQQEAAGITAVGKAEAEAIEAKGIAEAAAMEKRAEAYKKYNDTIKLQEALVEVLPEVAKQVAAPIAALKDVKLFGGSMSQINAEVPAMTKMVYETMSEATGVDMRDVLRSKTIQAQTDRNITTDDNNIVAVK